jgi:hypothetical protein
MPPHQFQIKDGQQTRVWDKHLPLPLLSLLLYGHKHLFHRTALFQGKTWLMYWIYLLPLLLLVMKLA